MPGVTELNGESAIKETNTNQNTNDTTANGGAQHINQHPNGNATPDKTVDLGGASDDTDDGNNNEQNEENYMPPETARELTQTDKINRHLLKSFLEHMKSQHMETEETDDDNSGEW